MKFSKGEYKTLCQEWDKPMHRARLAVEKAVWARRTGSWALLGGPQCQGAGTQLTKGFAASR